MSKVARKIFVSIAALAVVATAAANAQQSGNILDKAISTPSANWLFYGPNLASKPIDAPDVAGGHAWRVTVKGRGANPWDSGANMPVEKAAAAGDALLMAIYVRAPDLADGAKTRIANLGVQLAKAPYTPMFQGAIDVTNKWTLYYVSGRVAQNQPAGTLQMMVNLADEKRVLELGPAFLLDFGPDQDLAKLPKNS